jgi:hypothetical protein
MSKKELRDKYNDELPRLKKDIVALESLKKESNRYIPMLVTLASIPDEQIAQSVVDYNRLIDEAVGIVSTAIGCGCSVAGIGVTVFVGVSTTFYEVAKASMENLSGGGYGGDDPYGDAGTINLTSGSGSDTTINTQNLGKGVDSFVGSGSSVVMRVIYENIFTPSTCAKTCTEFEEERQSKLTEAANAQSGRSPLISQSDTFKDEIAEYEIQIWAVESGQNETQSKINRIETFLPNIQGD